MDLYPEIEVKEDEAQAIARGLYAVARADGDLHERERALVGEFFASISDRASDLAQLEREAAILPETLALALPRGDLRQLFLMTALLLAHCDSSYGPGEGAAIQRFASAMEVGTAELEEMTARVKEYMLAQLSHLENVDAAVEVAKELDV